MKMNDRFKKGYKFIAASGEKYFIANVAELGAPEYWCYPVSVQKRLNRKPSLMLDDDFNKEYRLCFGERELYELVLTAAEKKLAEGKISVDTPLGKLTACIGGDPAAYPEIFTYIVRPDGVEIDLTAAEVKLENNSAKAYLYGDTGTEQWTNCHQWTKDEINIECN